MRILAKSDIRSDKVLWFPLHNRVELLFIEIKYVIDNL